MKIKSTGLSPRLSISTGIVTLCILFSQNALSVELPVNNKNPVAKTTTRIKSLVSKNNNGIKIYPDFFKRKIHVIAKENARKNVDFFVFDMEGTLVHHYRMKPKDHRRITNMETGSYMFSAFCGDEETASGTFQIE